MAAFEKAISISPSPLVWNNIAYSLSEQNVQLGPSQPVCGPQRSTPSKRSLRDVNLSNLRMQDLGATELLVSIWDTKGWVEYKARETSIWLSNSSRLHGWPVAPARRLNIWAKLRRSEESAMLQFTITFLSTEWGTAVFWRTRPSDLPWA